MIYSHAFSKIVFRTVLIVVCVVLTFFASCPLAAQERAATVNSFNGEIVVLSELETLPESAFSKAGAPAVLRYRGEVRVVSSPQPTLPLSELAQTVPDGFRIVTQPGAFATLSFSDGSLIDVREMTILELNGFAWDEPTQSRGMLMSLYAGSVRVTLASAPKEHGSFFEIKTPNALVALHFSQPDVEVIYAPSPLENMTALLEEGVSLEPEEEGLWKEVFVAREKDVLRRKRTQLASIQAVNAQTGGSLQTVPFQGNGKVIVPALEPQDGTQEAFSQIGFIESEENALLQARLSQRDTELAKRVSQAAQVADTSEPGAGAFLPANIDLEQWETDGLITGEDESGKGTTCVFAYTVSVNFMNRLTRETRRIEHGQRAVVRGQGITMTVMDGSPMHEAPPRNVGTVFELDPQNSTSSSGKPGESSIQGWGEEDDPAYWLYPGSAGRTEIPWGQRPRVHNIDVIINEEK